MSDQIRVKVRYRNDRKCYQLYYRSPFSGLRVTRSTDASSPREAMRAAADWETELARSETVTDPSWDAFRIRFEDEHLVHKSNRTRHSYATALNRFEQLMGVPVRLSRITSSVMSQFSAALRAKGKPPSTIGMILRHVRGALSWAAKMDLIQSPPKVMIPSLAGESPMKGRPLTDHEFELLLAAVEKVVPAAAEHWRFALRGLWLSGLRLQEAQRLSWDSGPVRLDLTGGKYPRIIFQASGQKSRKAERLTITPDFYALVNAVPESKRKGKVFTLTSRAGRVISKIGEASGIVVNEAGKFASAHDLRRSYGDRWSRKLHPIDLRRLMRHRDIKTTLDYYVDHPDSEDTGEKLWETK